MTGAQSSAMRSLVVGAVAILATSLLGCMIVESHATSSVHTSGGACESTYGGGLCRYSVSGVVVDAETGSPVDSAEVRVGDYYAYTDRDGVFAVTTYVVPGCHQLIASHVGFSPEYVDVTFENRDLTVGPVGLWSARDGG
jgi:hypothetical protein